MLRHAIAGVFVLAAVSMPADTVAQGQTRTSAATFNPRDLTGVWTRGTEEFDLPPCRECQDTHGGYGYSHIVPPFTPEGQKRFDANIPARGWEKGSKEAAEMAKEVHAGRLRAVPPALSNDPQRFCNPLGVPRIVVYSANPMEIVQTADRVLQLFEWTWDRRDIWTDGRDLPAKIDYIPRWNGYSVGRWEGNAFVVNSYGFDDRAWVDKFGYPLSSEMRLEERYRLVDANTLELVMTITDPIIFTKPWVSTPKVWKRVPKANLANAGWAALNEDKCAPADEIDHFNTRVSDPAGLGGQKQ